MGALGVLIIVASLLVSAVVYLVSGGHAVLLALPLMIGFPLAKLFGKRRSGARRGTGRPPTPLG